MFGSKSESDFTTDALLLGEDLENIGIEGRGVINGQSEYDWRMNVIDDGYIRDNQKAAEAAGIPLMRSFPKEMDHRKIYPAHDQADPLQRYSRRGNFHYQLTQLDLLPL